MKKAKKHKKMLRGHWECHGHLWETISNTLPEHLQAEAMPDWAKIKRLLYGEPGLSEPDHVKGCTRRAVPSSWSALIKPDWAACGVEDIAEKAGRSKSFVEKDIKDKVCAVDKWNSKNWTSQNSLSFYDYLIETKQIIPYRKDVKNNQPLEKYSEDFFNSAAGVGAGTLQEK